MSKAYEILRRDVAAQRFEAKYGRPYPEKIEDRVALAKSYLWQEEPDFEIVLLLCGGDAEDYTADCLRMHGLLRVHKRSPYYDHEVGEKFFKYASERGCKKSQAWIKELNKRKAEEAQKELSGVPEQSGAGGCMGRAAIQAMNEAVKEAERQIGLPIVLWKFAEDLSDVLDTEYRKAVAKAVSLQKEILQDSGHASRNEYLRSKGVNVKTQDTKALAEELISDSNRVLDTDFALMLFDIDNETYDPEWVWYLCRIFDDSDTRRISQRCFDPVTAYMLYMVQESIEPGWGGAVAAYNLGSKNYYGELGPPDYEESARWFLRASDKGHTMGSYRLYQHLRDDPRYRQPGHEDFTSYADSFLAIAVESGNPAAKIAKAKYWAHGTEGYNDQAEVVRILHELCDGNMFARVTAPMLLAFRSFLGIGLPRDLKKAQAYIDFLVEGLGGEENLGLETESTHIRHLRDFIAKAEGLAEVVYAEAAERVKALYEGRTTKEDILSGIPPALRELYRDVFYVARQLANKEEWAVSYDVFLVFKELDEKCIGMDIRNLQKSALMQGPRYNVLASNKLPYLGELEQPDVVKAYPFGSPAYKEMIASVIKQVDERSFVPLPGVISFNGLKAEHHGSIVFDLTKSKDKPALLLPEDFDVALALAFGEASGSVWPILSLERAKYEDKGNKDRFMTHKEKFFSPAWLGHTDYGRTLYITDMLMGAFTFSRNDFYLASGGHSVPDGVANLCRDIFNDLAKTGGRGGVGSGKRIMVTTESVELTGVEPRQAKGKWFGGAKDKWVWDMKVKDVKMRVDGSYVLIKEDGKENRLVALNNDTYKHGRLVNKITERYNDIAKLMPVFERLRQLTGLTYSLFELRKQGFIPGQKLRQEIDEKYGRFQSWGELPPAERFVCGIPF